MFGPVSVSASYRQASRSLIARFLQAHHFDRDLAELVNPRKPFAIHPNAPWPEPAGLDDLDALVRDIEPDGKGIPVLLRHYLKLNGKFCAFNIDPAFGNCMDGLIVVDLDTAPPKQTERYMRK